MSSVAGPPLIAQISGLTAALAAKAPVASPSLTGDASLGGGTVLVKALGSADPALAAYPVWNAGGTTFTAFRVTATDGASAAGSLLAAFYNGFNGFTVRKDGATAILGGSFTDPTPALDISQTFNDAADTFTALKVNVTDTASAAASKLLDLQVGGTSKFSVAKDGVATFQAFSIGSGTIDGGGSLLISLSGNGGRLYPGSSGVRLTDVAASGAAFLQFGGSTSSFPGLKRSGANLAVRLADDSALSSLEAAAFSVGSGTIDGGGSLLISVSGAGGRLYPCASGVRLMDIGTTGAAFMQLGGDTSSFPGLKRSGTEVQARLADDSAFATVRGKLKLETAAAPSSASDTGSAGEVRWDDDYIYVCTATDTWKRTAIATW